MKNKINLEWIHGEEDSRLKKDEKSKLKSSRTSSSQKREEMEKRWDFLSLKRADFLSSGLCENERKMAFIVPIFVLPKTATQNMTCGHLKSLQTRVDARRHSDRI